MNFAPQQPPQEDASKKAIEDIFAHGNENVIKNWNTIPEELKEAISTKLISERAFSVANIEDMVRASDNNLGGLVNRLVKAGYYIDTLFDSSDVLLKRIEPKSLSQETFNALRDDGMSSTIQYCKDKGLFEDTVTFE